MLQMRQSMPNNLSCLRFIEVYPIDMSQMWMDCDSCEDPNDFEGGERMKLTNKTEHELWVLLDEIKKELDSRDEE